VLTQDHVLKLDTGLVENGNMIKLLDLLLEDIKPSEAYNDMDAIQTLVDGKRELAFIVEKNSPPSDWNKIQKIIADNGFKVMYVKYNPDNAYVVYTPGGESKANELKNIAEKYGGYLSPKATREETKRIGELLGYDRQSIEDFLKRHYPQ
jgi:hypothetical protein